MIVTLKDPETKVYNLFRWLGNIIEPDKTDSTGAIRISKNRDFFIATDKHVIVYAKLNSPISGLDGNDEFYHPMFVSRTLIQLETIIVNFIDTKIFFDGAPEKGYSQVVENLVTFDSKLFKKATAGFGQVFFKINQRNTPIWLTMFSDNFPAGAYFCMLMPSTYGWESERISIAYNRIKKAFVQFEQ